MRCKKMFQRCLIGCSLLILVGCSTPQAEPPQYETIAVDPTRNTELARRHNANAVTMINDGNLSGAEEQLKSALNADLFFGPAHNNLGLIYFKAKKFYLAAWEFQYAAKLMPHDPEPRNNLGLVLETVTKLDNAAQWYEKALKLKPGNVECTANLARVRVRQKKRDAETQELLKQVVLKDPRPEWVEWAKEQLAMMPIAKTTITPETKADSETPLTFQEFPEP